MHLRNLLHVHLVCLASTALALPTWGQSAPNAFPKLIAESTQESRGGATVQVASEIYFHNGEYHHEEHLMSLPGYAPETGANMGLDLTLHYRSRITFDGPFGHGWDLSVYERVKEEAGGVLDYYDGTGRVDRFSGLNTTTGVYSQNPPALHGTFVRQLGNADARYKYTDYDGIVREFDSQGRIQRIVDRWDHKIVFAYKSPAKPFQLTSITDTTGRTIHFNYADSGRLSSIKDFGGRVIGFEHSKLGNLTKIASMAPNDGRPGSSATCDMIFGYTGADPKDLTAITRPDGTLFLTNTYDASSRVVQQGQPGLTWNIAYDTAGAACRVTGNDGRRRTWGNSAAGSPIPTWRKTWSGGYTALDPDATPSTPKTRPSAASVVVNSMAYDAHGRLLEIVYPRGNSLRVQRNAVGQVTSERRKQVATDPDGPSDLVNSYTYDAAHWYLQRSAVDPMGKVIYFDYDFDEATMGDLNLDGVTNGTKGALVRTRYPSVTAPFSGVALPVHELDVPDAHGLTTRSVDGEGRVVDYEWAHTANATLGTIPGRLVARIVDPMALGLRTEYTYDPYGNRKTETNPLLFTTTYIYNDRDLLIETQHPLADYRTELWYDKNDRVVEERVRNVVAGVVQPNEWLSTWFTYDALDEVLTETNEISLTQDRVTTRTYTSRRQLATVTDATGVRTDYEYDDFHFLWKRTVAANDATLSGTDVFDYDNNGNRVSDTDPLSKTTTYYFDLFDREFARIEPDGSVVVETLRADGQPDQVARFDQNPLTGGQLIWRKYHFYDELGREHLAALDGLGGTPAFHVFEHHRDRSDLLIKDVEPGNEVVEYTYDGARRQLTERDALGNESRRVFDAAGRMIAEDKVEAGVGGLVTHMEFQYDALDRRRSDGRLDPVTGTTYYLTRQFNSLDLVVAETEEDGAQSNFTYDGVGNVTDVFEDSYVDEDGSLVRVHQAFQYDLAGRRTRVTDDNGSVQSYTYNAAGRLVDVRVLGSSQPNSTLTYDRHGNLQTIKDGSGNQATLIYDHKHRLTQRDWTLANGTEGIVRESFGYNKRGELTSAANYTATSMPAPYSTNTFTYDAYGALLTDTSTVEAGPAQTVQYVYDTAGQLSQTIYPSGMVVHRGYDALGRNEWILADGGLVAYSVYTGFDRLRSVQLGNGTLQDLTAADAYDPLGRMTHYEHKDALGSAMVSRTLSYTSVGGSACGCRQDIAWIGDDLAGTYDVYDYDLSGRLRSARLQSQNAAGLNPARTLLYQPADAKGNLSELDDSLAPALRFCTDGSSQYSTVGGAALNCDTATRNMTYDARGNLIHDAHKSITRTFNYDVHNHVVRARRGGVDVAHFGYDAIGRRVQRTDVASGEVRRFVFDGRNEIEERVGYGEALERRFVYGVERLDQRLRQERWLTPGVGAPEVHYLHADQVSSVLAATDAAGALVERYSYLPYGDVTIMDPSGAPRSTSVLDLRYLYTGRYREEGLELYDVRARMFDPELARFLQPDPLGSVDGPNPYEYARSSPIGFNDPSGMHAAPAGDIDSLDCKAKGCAITCTKYYTFSSEGCDTQAPKGEKPKEKKARVAADKKKVDDKKKEFLDAMKPWEGTCPCKEGKGKGCSFKVTAEEADRPTERNKASNVTIACGAKKKSGKRDLDGFAGTDSAWIHLDANQPTMTHEHGHGLGLEDRYKENGDGTTSPKTEKDKGSIMAEQVERPNQSDICNAVKGTGECDEDKCCPKSSLVALYNVPTTGATTIAVGNPDYGVTMATYVPNELLVDGENVFNGRTEGSVVLSGHGGSSSEFTTQVLAESIWSALLVSTNFGPYPVELEEANVQGF